MTNQSVPPSFQVDDDGFLVDPDVWTEAVAEELARRNGVSLTPDHWKVIYFMRQWLEERQVAPDARHVMKFLSGSRNAGRQRLFELYPYGYVKQACRIAGMRKPRAWSTG